MFNDLPSRIAGKTNGSGVVTSSDVRVHLELVESLLNTVKEPRIRILSALSLFKLKMPWIYEIGIETLRLVDSCLLYTSPSPRDKRQSRMPSSA